MKKRIGWAILLAAVLISCIRSQREGARPASRGLEDIQWQLVEVGGFLISPLPEDRRPFIRFDAIKKQASGFAGCNNFFGSYELSGSSLKIGPVGSTRMACPDLETGLETEFLKALDRTRGWEIRNGMLLLTNDSEVLARFTMSQEDAPVADLGSMTFLSTRFSSGKVTLSTGEYRKPAAPGSASAIVVKLIDKRAFGLIHGKEIGAVVLVTDSGGSGTFYDLALLTKEAGGWANTDTVLLGDRVKVHAVKINANAIVIDMTTHSPDDPMCCPTLEVKKRFAVQGNHLVHADEGTAGEEPQITGTVWQWIQTLYNDDRKSAPAKPENYTISFLEDGKVSVKADCYLKRGTYSLEDKRLSIEITHSTMAACQEGSFEKEFVRDLMACTTFFFKDGNLYIDLKYDTGTMKLTSHKGE